MISDSDNNLSECNGDSGSGCSEFISSKSTSKIIKIFIKCFSALIQHLDNVLCPSDELIPVDIPSKVLKDEIDIVEHTFKEDPDGNFQHLNSIKKCLLQLSVICLEQNINVNCDLSFHLIDYYKCLDNSSKSFVIDYFAENVSYLTEHVSVLINMFKHEKDPEDTKNIRKSILKIYKQIVLIPLNPTLDETPEKFKNLNSSLRYAESQQILSKNLSLLKIKLIKFKKIFKRRALIKVQNNSSVFLKETDDTSNKRKLDDTNNTANLKRCKQEKNELEFSYDNFLIPSFNPNNQYNNKIKKKNGTVLNISENDKNESNTKKGPKQKNIVVVEENDANVEVIKENNTCIIKKKQKNNLQNVENVSGKEEREVIKKKINLKIKLDDIKSTTEVEDTVNGHSDYIPLKSTSKVLKSFMKCITALIQHLDNVLCNSDGLIPIDTPIKIKLNDENNTEIDVMEHSFKQEPDDIFRHINNIKKCALQLSVMFVEQNIYVNCDLSFHQIDYYNCLDNSTKSFVIDYLTENVAFLTEHVGFLIDMFKQDRDPEDAKNIRKSLLKIYKQIILIPLDPKLDETPENFKNLDSILWYAESLQNLTEKLEFLRTSLIKLKKIFKTRAPNPDRDNSVNCEEINDFSNIKNTNDIQKLEIRSHNLKRTENRNENILDKPKNEKSCKSKLNSHEETKCKAKSNTVNTYLQNDSKYNKESISKHNTKKKRKNNSCIEKNSTAQKNSHADNGIKYDSNKSDDYNEKILNSFTTQLDICDSEIYLDDNSDYEDDRTRTKKILKDTSLTDNEKCLFIQDLVLSVKEKSLISSEDLKQKFADLNIFIDWEVPQTHLIATSLIRGPTLEQQQTLNALGVSNKRFNLEEDKTIQRNWKLFCKIHNINDDPRPFLKFYVAGNSFLKYEERKKFIQFLGRDLPNRTLQSLYRRFKILYREENKFGRFSSEEDEIILYYCNKVKNDSCKFVTLASILNRSKLAIECRYRRLSHDKERIIWTIEKDAKLIKDLLRITGFNEVNNLRYTPVSTNNYKEIANFMNVSHLKVRIHWLNYVYPKLFAGEPLNLRKIRLKIIQLLNDTGETDWAKLDWNEIISHFDSLTKEFIWRQLRILLQIIPKIHHKNLGKCQELLKNMKNNDGNIFREKYIKRYRLNDDGELETYI